MRMVASCCLLFLGTLLLAPSLSAQDSYFYVNPNIGTAFFFGDLDEESSEFGAFKLDNTPSYGVNLGTRLNGQLGVEGSFTFMPSDATFEDLASGLVLGFNTNVLLYTANVSYAFASPKTSAAGYVVAGAGGMTIDPDVPEGSDLASAIESSTGLVFNAGAGLEIPISDVTLLRAELRDYITTTDAFVAEGQEGKTVNNLIFTGGLSFILQ